MSVLSVSASTYSDVSHFNEVFYNCSHRFWFGLRVIFCLQSILSNFVATFKGMPRSIIFHRYKNTILGLEPPRSPVSAYMAEAGPRRSSVPKTEHVLYSDRISWVWDVHLMLCKRGKSMTLLSCVFWVLFKKFLSLERKKQVLMKESSGFSPTL